MCGFVGYIDSRGVREAAPLIAMNDSLSHRGPDGSGTFAERNVALGHRRLSILDLRDEANQPMFGGTENRFAIAFNGEVYNFRELRRDLEARGEVFATTGDTEVVLRSLMLDGPEAIARFNGMFALAFYDRHTKRLLLARDRFGVKPLYVVQQGPVTAFASEAKAFRHHPDLRMKLDEDGLAEYLTFMNFISGATLFKGVRLFPAGHWVEIDTTVPPEPLRPVQFWDYRFTGNREDFDGDALADEIHASFTQAVQRQLVSDVGVSSYLSGGVDSGSITAVSAASVDALRTFTAHFDYQGATDRELAFDERAAAQLMADSFGTSHFETRIGPEDFERVFSDLCRALDEPRVGQSYPNYIVSELARSHEKVVLSGAGGDELFAGYPWRYYQGFPAEDFQGYIDGYYAYWRRLAKTDAELESLIGPNDFDGRAVMESVFPAEAKVATAAPELLNWALYFEAKTFLEGLLLVEDKVAMAHGLETRVPFLDNDLVDLAQTVPIQAKLAGIGGELERRLREVKGLEVESRSRRMDGKAILRHMMSRLVPDEITNRAKQGFSAPDGSWWAGRSYGFVEERLLGKSRRLHDVIDPKEIRAVLEGHRDGTRMDGRHKIWAFLNLAEALDNFGL